VSDLAGRAADRDPQRNVRASARDLVLSLLFVLLWLLPIFYQGWTSSTIPPSVLPPFLTNIYRVSCLFTKSVPAWGDWYFQLKHVDDPGWWTLRESDYSKLEPFGHHSRIDLFLSKSGNYSTGTAQRQAIADFIRKRHRDLFPDRPEVEAIRFVKAVYKVEVGGELARPARCWEKKPLGEVALASRHVVGIYYFDGREPDDRHTRSLKRRRQERPRNPGGRSQQ